MFFLKQYVDEDLFNVVQCMRALWSQASVNDLVLSLTKIGQNAPNKYSFVVRVCHHTKMYW